MLNNLTALNRLLHACEPCGKSASGVRAALDQLFDVVASVAQVASFITSASLVVPSEPAVGEADATSDVREEHENAGREELANAGREELATAGVVRLFAAV